MINQKKCGQCGSIMHVNFELNMFECPNCLGFYEKIHGGATSSLTSEAKK